MWEIGENLPARPLDAGETLIEALVVVAIMGLISAIVFPQMRQTLMTLSQRQAMATVAARLRDARAEALHSDSPVVFAISPDGSTYGDAGGAFGQAPPGVSLAFAPARADGIVFYGDGSSSGGAVLVNAGRRSARITVTKGTGVVAMGAP